MTHADRIAHATRLPPRGVSAALSLFDEGATVPFIARYRKERTGGLDEVQLRAISEEAERLKELDARRDTITRGIEALGALTPALREALAAAGTRGELEDLWLPFRKKRTTRASIARERGLEPLAELILAQGRRSEPLAAARAFVAPARDVPDPEAALAGARDIVAETMAETPSVRGGTRRAFIAHGRLRTRAVKKTTTGVRTPFEGYYDWQGRLAGLPSHRILAALRGAREGFLRVSVELDDARIIRDIEGAMGLDPRSPMASQLRLAIEDGYSRLLRPAIEGEVLKEAKARADEGAIAVFAANLEALLLAPPLGQVTLLAIDPGMRTGCKVVALSPLGELLDHLTIYPHTGRLAEAARDLEGLLRRFDPRAVAIGNGTGGRETEAFVRRLLGERGLGAVDVIMVNEAGASIYSASDVAREEFPELDLTYRGAISIGRRLQDPLAELVKLDPKSIGVGQYQHDVDQAQLQRALDATVETVVNRVGVDLNSASPHLLRRVAGIGPGLADAIVNHRRSRGAFRTRAELRAVKGLGPQRFMQAAGFLRIRDGAHPLDASAVHPERYALVASMAARLRRPLPSLIGDVALLKTLRPADWVQDDAGEPTIIDILSELGKPGRDPRSTFEAPAFKEGVRAIADLEAGMILGGVVTNVTAFGAFVDIGVHQDGLVHISALAKDFVSDPHAVVQSGQAVTVKVLSVDAERRRIGLSMKDVD